MKIEYTKAEKFLLSEDSNLYEVPNHKLERLALDLTNTNYEYVGFAIELGRDSSTDLRTYTLHIGYNLEHPMKYYIEFDWYKPSEMQHLV